MKIVFNKLQTSKETIQVSLDGGATYTPYVVSEIINDGIPLDENQDLEKIQIKGSSSVLKNLDVITSVSVGGVDLQPTKLYVWGMYHYKEIVCTFSRYPKVGDLAYIFGTGSLTTDDNDSTKNYHVKMCIIAAVKEAEIVTNGLTYSFQNEFELHAGYFNVNFFDVGYLIEN